MEKQFLKQELLFGAAVLFFGVVVFCLTVSFSTLSPNREALLQVGVNLGILMMLMGAYNLCETLAAYWLHCRMKQKMHCLSPKEQVLCLLKCSLWSIDSYLRFCRRSSLQKLSDIYPLFHDSGYLRLEELISKTDYYLGKRKNA